MPEPIRRTTARVVRANCVDFLDTGWFDPEELSHQGQPDVARLAVGASGR